MREELQSYIYLYVRTCLAMPRRNGPRVKHWALGLMWPSHDTSDSILLFLPIRWLDCVLFNVSFDRDWLWVTVPRVGSEVTKYGPDRKGGWQAGQMSMSWVSSALFLPAF